MNLDLFQQSIKANDLPAGISIYLQALWYDGAGDWHKAHHLVDSLDDKSACWVHAYLHRKEGDLGNADYWYRRAVKKRPDISLLEEWEQLVNSFLSS
ncbi:MAG: hypothetical protein QM791_09345 [Ferruginibacter sp.]